MTAIEVFKQIVPLFQKEGYQIYMVGGSARDFLLKRDFDDLDLATDAPPSRLIEMFPEANHRFVKYGNIHFIVEEVSVDITALRVESEYSDARHPHRITFVDSIQKDARRRDFTINALYIDPAFRVYDFFDGLADLSRGVIRMIGDPNIRLCEDPLRIVRALRFSLLLGFQIDEVLDKALLFYHDRLEKLTKAKVKQEVSKMRKIDEKKTIGLLEKYQISGW